MPREARTSISMTAVLSRVDTPLVGSSRRIISGRRANAAATSSSFLSPLRQRAARHVELLGEAEQLGDLLGVPPDLAVGGERAEEPAAAAQARHGGRLERLGHRQLGEDLDELEAPREPEPREPHRADAPDVPPLEAHGAAAAAGGARSAR